MSKSLRVNRIASKRYVNAPYIRVKKLHRKMKVEIKQRKFEQKGIDEFGK